MMIGEEHSNRNGKDKPGGDSAFAPGTGQPENLLSVSDRSAQAPAAEIRLNESDRAFLLRLARETIRNAAGVGPMPHVYDSSIPPALLVRRGCFVTLFRRGELRGCIGHIFAQAALYRVVMEAAHGAAMRDPRFPAVAASEIDELQIEISVLTEPVPVEAETPDQRLAAITPGKHGVVLRLSGRSWTFLPQVWKHFPKPEEFLARLCAKAGAEHTAWRDSRVELLLYETESFEEPGWPPGAAV